MSPCLHTVMKRSMSFNSVQTESVNLSCVKHASVWTDSTSLVRVQLGVDVTRWHHSEAKVWKRRGVFVCKNSTRVCLNSCLFCTDNPLWIFHNDKIVSGDEIVLKTRFCKYLLSSLSLFIQLICNYICPFLNNTFFCGTFLLAFILSGLWCELWGVQPTKRAKL